MFLILKSTIIKFNIKSNKLTKIKNKNYIIYLNLIIS